MPELPEMETYRNLLLPRLRGQRITHVHVGRERSLNLPSAEFIRSVQHSTVMDVKRRAKYLLFQLDTDHVLLLHLMLGGLLYWGTEEDKPDRTVQITLSFGKDRLYFIGLRLGYLHLHSAESVRTLLSKLGPEPLASDFGLEQFRKAMAGKRGKLKTTLTDQTVLAGIGNCYVDEICHAAGLRPDRTLSSLSDQEMASLYDGLRSVLAEAVSVGGYMEVPLYAGDRLTGGYNARCRVYDREGEPCPRCGSAIIRLELASRKTFLCPGCQR